MQNARDILNKLRRKGSIKRTLSFFVLLVVLLNVIFTTVFSYYLFSSAIETRIFETDKQALTQMIRNIDYILKGVENAFVQSFDGKDIERKIQRLNAGTAKERADHYQALVGDLKEFCSLKNQVESVYLIREDGIIAGSEQLDFNDAFQVSEIMRKERSFENHFGWGSTSKSEIAAAPADRLFLTGKIGEGDTFVVLFLKPDAFGPAFANVVSTENALIIKNKQNEQVIVPLIGQTETPVTVDYFEMEEKGRKTAESGEEKYILSSAVSDYTEWVYCLAKPYKSALRDVSAFGKRLAITGGLCAAFFVGAGIFVSTMFARRVETLKAEINSYFNPNEETKKKRGRKRREPSFSFRAKIITVFIVLLLLPIIVIEAVSYFSYQDIAFAKLREQSEYITSQRQNRLETYLQNTDRSLYYFYYHNKTQDLFYRDQMEESLAKEAAAFIYAQNPYMLYLDFYDQSRDRIFSTNLRKNSEQPTEMLLALDKQGNDKTLYFTTQKDSAGQYALPVGKRISDIATMGHVGYIMLYLDEEAVGSICFDNIHDSSFAYIIGRGGELISHPNKNLLGKNIFSISKGELFAGLENKLGFSALEGAIENSSTLSNGWTVVNVFSTKPIADSLKNQLLWAAFITLMNIVFLIALVSYISLKVTHPLRELSLQTGMYLKNVGNQNHLVVKTNDEIEQLSVSFENMKMRLDTLVHEVYEEKIKYAEAEYQKKEAEMSLFQSQINPHFLYNTLNFLRWKAMTLTAGENEVTDLISNLSDFFRLSLSKGEMLVSLETEVEHAKKYMKLMAFRCENIECKFVVQKETLKCQVPKIILQPILENALNHGVLPMEKQGIICVDVRMVLDEIQISVEDNGVGMDEEVLQSIRDTLAGAESGEKGGKGYGIKNVNQRIQYYYSREYGVQIFSEKGRGTKVLIILPGGRDQSMGEGMTE